MQVQMEVCNLNECDFLETRFIEYDSYNDFMADGSFTLSETDNIKGTIVCFIQNEKPLYEYAPLYLSQEEYEKWEEDIMEKHKEKVWLRNIYWKLDEISCVLVLRNKFWFNATKHILQEVWDSIEKERITGHKHRAPVSRSKPTTVKTRSCNVMVTNDNKDNSQKEEHTSNDKELNDKEEKILSPKLSNINIKFDSVDDNSSKPPRKPSITIDI